MAEEFLRPYQANLVGAIRRAFAGARRVLATLPTGGGKSRVAAATAAAAAAKGLRVLVVAHRLELVEQLQAALAAAGLPAADVYLPGREVEGRPVAVGSVQTLSRRAAQGWDLVIIDEAHHAVAETYRPLFEARYVLGLTATPVRADGRGLGGVFEAMVNGPTMAELIEAGYLARPRYFTTQGKPWVEAPRGADYDPREIDPLVRRVELEGEVVQAYLDHLQGQTALVFAVTREHGRELGTRFRKAGVEAAFLDGQTPEVKRAEALARLKDGHLKVVVNVGLFTEGLDVPTVGGVILARPTASLGLYLQMAGRALRPAPGKAETPVIDVTGVNFRRFGPAEGYGAWTLTDGVVEPQAVRVKGPAAPTQGRQVTQVQEGSAPLLEVKEEAVDRKRYYFDLLRLAAHRGYKPGWAAHKYRERFGAFPAWAWLDEYRAQEGGKDAG